MESVSIAHLVQGDKPMANVHLITAQKINLYLKMAHVRPAQKAKNQVQTMALALVRRGKKLSVWVNGKCSTKKGLSAFNAQNLPEQTLTDQNADLMNAYILIKY